MPPSLPVSSYVNGHKSLENHATARVVFGKALEH